MTEQESAGKFKDRQARIDELVQRAAVAVRTIINADQSTDMLGFMLLIAGNTADHPEDTCVCCRSNIAVPVLNKVLGQIINSRPTKVETSAGGLQ